MYFLFVNLRRYTLNVLREIYRIQICFKYALQDSNLKYPSGDGPDVIMIND